MIYGIGTDIVKVSRINDSIARHGERFAERILTPGELEAYRESIKKANFLAKRFAAKEALVKAMGTGFRDGITLRDITVINTDHGQPQLNFSEALQVRHQEMGIAEAFLSLSDEDDYALAFVTLTRK